MKISKYNWENRYLLDNLSRSVLNFDLFYAGKSPYGINIKMNLDTTKNIDFAKILSLNLIISPKKSFVNTKESVDRNPLKLKTTNKKNLKTSLLLENSNDRNTIFYVYYAYLFNLFKNKNINFNVNAGPIYNVNIKEINSILKVGYAYNVLDIDPSIDLNFSGIKNPSLIKLMLTTNETNK